MLERIRAEFGEDVAAIVEASSDTLDSDDRRPWRQRKEALGRVAELIKIAAVAPGMIALGRVRHLGIFQRDAPALIHVAGVAVGVSLIFGAGWFTGGCPAGP